MAQVKQTGIGKFEITASGKEGHTWAEMKDVSRQDAEEFARKVQRIMDGRRELKDYQLELGLALGIVFAVIHILWGAVR